MRHITWDPNAKGSSVGLSNNNLTASLGGLHAVRATEGKSKGKWYWEVRSDTGGSIYIGIDDGIETVSHHGDTSRNNRQRGYVYTGEKFGTTRTSYGPSFTTNDVIGIALDLDNGTIKFFKNGADLGIAFTNVLDMTLPVYPRVGAWGSSGTKLATANFGATPFAYPIPKGFSPYESQYIITVQSNDGIHYYYDTQSDMWLPLKNEMAEEDYKSLEAGGIFSLNKNVLKNLPNLKNEKPLIKAYKERR